MINHLNLFFFFSFFLPQYIPAQEHYLNEECTHAEDALWLQAAMENVAANKRFDKVLKAFFKKEATEEEVDEAEVILKTTLNNIQAALDKNSKDGGSESSGSTGSPPSTGGSESSGSTSSPPSSNSGSTSKDVDPAAAALNAKLKAYKDKRQKQFNKRINGTITSQPKSTDITIQELIALPEREAKSTMGISNHFVIRNFEVQHIKNVGFTRNGSAVGSFYLVFSIIQKGQEAHEIEVSSFNTNIMTMLFGHFDQSYLMECFHYLDDLDKSGQEYDEQDPRFIHMCNVVTFSNDKNLNMTLVKTFKRDGKHYYNVISVHEA